MRRCPGILFADGPTGRRARVTGTGLDAWEVIATYQSAGRNLKRLKAAHPQLDETKLRAALSYYECYREGNRRENLRERVVDPADS